MSQPRDPYRQYPQQSYGQYPPDYGQRYPQPQPPQRPRYPEHERGYERDAPVRQRPEPRPPSRPAPQPSRPASGPSLVPKRLPGLGLLLTGLGLAIQILCLTVLPWVRVDAAQGASLSLPELFDLATEVGAHGFGAWYVVLAGYPLAVLSILLALASVLNSVALKMIWGGLTVAGLGFLVLRYGFGPFAELATGDGPLDFSRQEITTAAIAAAALVVVIFALKMAVSMFRRVAGLILLGFAAIHVAAVADLATDSTAELGIGAYGPAVGYVLVAIAAFVGPRRLPGV
ncbi:hypothetical protein [Actinophytocola sp.]|uniref:hypothetical protein n=1 Tax=Actinophytocola sp. TaxID=1872138 RepID=UPI002D7EFCEB|nr:hypothetical protein [Actinophytocola sp.]HET9140095.1 hypothetical protein [Actinophytocola sp.]